MEVTDLPEGETNSIFNYQQTHSQVSQVSRVSQDSGCLMSRDAHLGIQTKQHSGEIGNKAI